MNREELIDYLDMNLSQRADGPPAGPRPEGTIVMNLAGRPLSGLRLVAPDGSVFYLAVLTAEDADRPPAPRPAPRGRGGA